MSKNNEPEVSIKELMSPHTEITAKLRQLFIHLEQEPLPDHYIELLNKLDMAEQEQKSKSKN